MITAAGSTLPSAGAQQAGGTFPVQVGVTVQPETVTVGDPFLVAVRLRAPRGAVVTFPQPPDSGSSVEALDPRRLITSPDSSAVDQTSTYRVVAWGVDSRSVSLGPATVRLGAVERSVSLGRILVFVRSVLPADSALRVPKPARDIVEDDVPWWKRWWWLLPLLALLALVALLLWRRRLRGRPDLVEDPFVHAEREFARVEAMGLVEAGERGRFVALVVEVLRDYLAARVDRAIPALTSAELLRAVQSVAGVPVTRLSAVLDNADLVKFARHRISADGARELAREARSIVSDADRELTKRGGETPLRPRAEAA